MSNLTTVYDAFLARLVTLFPAKTYIPNPYSLEDNIISHLRDGYGLRVDEETDTNTQFNFFTGIHSFTVILTRELIRTENDVDAVHTVVKLLKEDVFALKLSLYDNDTLTSPKVHDKIDFGSVSGINFIITDNNNFLSIEATFLIQLREQAANC